MRALDALADHTLSVIDQTLLPHRSERVVLRSAAEVERAIITMVVRGAPLIGVAGAYGLALALKADPSSLEPAFARLDAARPTAVNLRWALEQVRAAVVELPPAARFERAWAVAQALAQAEAEACRRIGEHGLALLRALPHRPLRVLTHCNAGWLATGEWGTALAPVYLAHQAGLPIEVWVDETRPRNQGALTAWELHAAGVPHTVVVDNAGGLLMQQGLVDACLVGADRIAANGDVCNKVGTYLKALAARDCGVPFYVAAPRSTIDRALSDGAAVTIEHRSPDEVRRWGEARLHPEQSRVHNPAFDLTPARLVSAIITEVGVAEASAAGLAKVLA